MNYKKTLLLFIISLVIFSILYFLFKISLWWIIVPVLFLKTSVIYGSATIRSNFFTNVLCSGITDKKEIAITFDDGPNNSFTNEILSTLDAYEAKATFFVIGKNIPGNEDIIKNIFSKGHTIGNHTFSHSYFIDFKNTAFFVEEIKKTSELIVKITGKSMRLFRPPYGVTTPPIAKATKALNYDVIGWNIRSLDTTKDSAETIIKRFIRQIKPGSIVLFHDTSIKTNIVLKNVLEYLKQNGIRIVSVSDILNIRAYND